MMVRAGNNNDVNGGDMLLITDIQLGEGEILDDADMLGDGELAFLDLEQVSIVNVNSLNIGNVEGNVTLPSAQTENDLSSSNTDAQCHGSGVMSTVTGGVGYAASSVWGVTYTVISGTGYLLYDGVATVSSGIYNGAKNLASWVLSHYY